MSAIAPTLTQVTTPRGTLVHVVSWTLANGDTGVPYQMPNQFSRSMHAFGTFGAGGSVKMRGSNEVAQPAAGATTWADLHDAQGVAIALTAAKVSTIGETTNWVSPMVTAGDGTTSITVAMLARQS